MAMENPQFSIGNTSSFMVDVPLLCYFFRGGFFLTENSCSAKEQVEAIFFVHTYSTSRETAMFKVDLKRSLVVRVGH